MTKYRTETEERRRALLLRDLMKAKTSYDNAVRRLEDAVGICRAPDLDDSCLVSWDDIGRVLGITKQAAQQRFARRGIT